MSLNNCLPVFLAILLGAVLLGSLVCMFRKRRASKEGFFGILNEAQNFVNGLNSYMIPQNPTYQQVDPNMYKIVEDAIAARFNVPPAKPFNMNQYVNNVDGKPFVCPDKGSSQNFTAFKTTTYDGLSRGRIKDAENQQACARFCEKHKDCTGFSFRSDFSSEYKPSRTCTLYKVGNGSISNRATTKGICLGGEHCIPGTNTLEQFCYKPPSAPVPVPVPIPAPIYNSTYRIPRVPIPFPSSYVKKP